MKKLPFISAVFFLLIAFAACKKEGQSPASNSANPNPDDSTKVIDPGDTTAALPKAIITQYPGTERQQISCREPYDDLNHDTTISVKYITIERDSMIYFYRGDTLSLERKYKKRSDNIYSDGGSTSAHSKSYVIVSNKLRIQTVIQNYYCLDLTTFEGYK